MVQLFNVLIFYGPFLVIFGVNAKESCYILYYMGLVATKPVFGVSDKVSFKSVSSATETS